MLRFQVSRVFCRLGTRACAARRARTTFARTANDMQQKPLSSFFKKKEAATEKGPASDAAAAHSTATAAAAPKRKLPASLHGPPTPAATSPTGCAPMVDAPAVAAPASPAALAAPAAKPKDLDPVKPAAEQAAVWMWQSGPSWTPYEPEQSALLERAWAANEPRAPLDNTRHVDFHTMRQARGAHLTHPSTSRLETRSCEARAHARGSLAACHHR